MVAVGCAGLGRTLAWLGLSACLAGCGAHKKTKECNAFVGVVNGGIERIQKLATSTTDAGTAVAELRTLADEMDGIGREAAKVQLTIAELGKLAQDYGAMVAEVAAAARELAGAVDKVDMQAVTRAQERMEAAVKREDGIVESVNRYCRSP
jgi:DNA repair ATPase RecN